MKITYDPRPAPLGRLGRFAESILAHLLALLTVLLPRSR
jgi:hypothetical protein